MKANLRVIRELPCYLIGQTWKQTVCVHVPFTVSRLMFSYVHNSEFRFKTRRIILNKFGSMFM